MNAGWTQNESLVDLLAERAVAGLPAAEEARCAELCRASGAPGDAFEREVGVLDAVFAGSVVVDGAEEALPESARRGLEAAAAAFVAGRGASMAPALRLAGESVTTRRMSRGVWGGAWLGWTAAAACAALALTAWVTRPDVSAVGGPGAGGGMVQATPTDADYRRWMAEVTARAEAGGGAGGAISTAWLGIDDAKLAPAAHQFDAQLTGRIVWDAEGQRGWMAFSGLAANEPGEYQYQLWIFDAERPIGELPEFAVEGLPILTQRPVDGGVFDIDPRKVGADGTVVVPIDAKLPVGKAVLFAITVEPPGGSVVSKRDIVAVAVAG